MNNSRRHQWRECLLTAPSFLWLTLFFLLPTLIIFAIMLTEHLGEKTIRQNNRQSPAAIICLLGFVTVLGIIIFKTPWPITAKALQATASVSSLGKALMGPYVFPFEVISVILIAALIGAVVIAQKEKDQG